DPSWADGWAARALLTLRWNDPRALDDVEKALAMDPRCARAFVARARVHVGKRDFAAALDDAERALALRPELVPAWVARANARGLLRDRAGAVADLDRAIELAPRAPFLYSQ